MRRLHRRDRGVESGHKRRVNNADRHWLHSSGDADWRILERAAADHQLELRPSNAQQTLAGRRRAERAVPQGEAPVCKQPPLGGVLQVRVLAAPAVLNDAAVEKDVPFTFTSKHVRAAKLGGGALVTAETAHAIAAHAAPNDERSSTQDSESSTRHRGAAREAFDDIAVQTAPVQVKVPGLHGDRTSIP
jgi:hypothetical protein